jgi:tetratricopeptide (TPR) repeat protein
MRTNLDPKMKHLLEEMTRVRELTEMQHYEEARAACLKLRADCARHGIRSAHLAWGLAVVCDGLGEFEAAVTYIKEALEIDPLAIPYQRSFDVIIDRIRRTLGDANRDPADSSTPRLYEILTRAGEGDANSHLAMARFYHHTGDHKSAMKILDAVTTLAPASRPAWQYKAIVARAMGDIDTAASAEVESAALESHDPIAFTVFAQPQARG